MVDKLSFEILNRCATCTSIVYACIQVLLDDRIIIQLVMEFLGSDAVCKYCSLIVER